MASQIAKVWWTISGPVVELLAFTAAVALVTWLFGWYPAETWGIAVGLGFAVAALAAFLVRRRGREPQAAAAALHNVEVRTGGIVDSAMDPIITVDDAQTIGSEARLRGIVDSAMDAIITVDETQHVVMFNAAAEAMFGCTQDEAIGAPLSSFLPERFRATHDLHVRRFGETGISARRMGALRVVAGLRRNGHEFPIDASISQHTDGAQRFFTVILRDVTQRVEAERALLRSKEELQALALSAHQAREQEQNRIARELHDELGQSLTALRMMVVWIRERTGENDAELSAKLARMGELLSEMVVTMRRISSELRPLILDDLGLVPAIEALVEQFTDRTGIACELAVDDPALELADAQKTAVFRIVQESLTNVVKHARATRAEVTIQQADGEITINVSDNGVGFAVNAPGGQQSHGLLGMRERAYLLRGEMKIMSSPGNGTTLEVRLPTMSGGA